MKTCTKCKITRHESKFYKDRSRKDGLTNWCKNCQKKRMRKYNHSFCGRAVLRARNHRRHYGITVEDYDRMFKEQAGVCAICEQPETTLQNGILKRLSVDHNHTTGQIRGLLCSGCNMKVGVVEAYELISKINTYLKGYSD